MFKRIKVDKNFKLLHFTETIHVSSKVFIIADKLLILLPP